MNELFDLFKSSKAFELNNLYTFVKGNVSFCRDALLKRNFIRIEGKVSKENQLIIPNIKYGKGLGLKGEFMYIEYRYDKTKKFSIVVMVQINGIKVKCSFLYPLKEMRIVNKEKNRKIAFVEIPIILNQDHDNADNSLRYDEINLSSIGDLLHIPRIELKNQEGSLNLLNDNDNTSKRDILIDQIELNCSIDVFGVFISKKKLEINKTKQKINSNRNNKTNTINNLIPDSLAYNTKDVENHKTKEKDTDESNDTLDKLLEGKIRSHEQNIKFRVMNKSISLITNSQPINDSSSVVSARVKEIQMKMELEDKSIIHSVPNEDKPNEILVQNSEAVMQDYLSTKKIANPKRLDKTIQTALEPNPIITPLYVVNYTPFHCRNVLFIQSKYSLDSSESILFSANDSLIKLNYSSYTQSIINLPGDIKHIASFNLGKHILLIQEGKKCAITIISSDTYSILNTVITAYSTMSSIAIDLESKYLITIGNIKAKEKIALWSLVDLSKISMLIKQGSPSHIRNVTFCPYESNIFFTYGKQNVREWIMKKEHFTSRLISLGQENRDTEVLCLEYTKANSLITAGDETNEFNLSFWKLYLGCVNGNVIQICYKTKNIECVFKIFESGITSIASSDSYISVGSSNGLIRLYLISFGDFIVEARVDNEICSLVLSKDNQRVLCGSMNAEIGIVDLINKIYHPVLRKPTHPIAQVYTHPNGQFLFTIGKDSNVILVWNSNTKREEYKYNSEHDKPLSICAKRHDANVFLCGFTSGVIRVFNLSSIKAISEIRVYEYNTGITSLSYIQNESLLLAIGSNGVISVLDDKFICIKVISNDELCFHSSVISISIDSLCFSLANSDLNTTYAFDSLSLAVTNRIPIEDFSIVNICIFNKNLIGVILENLSLRFYSLCCTEGVLIKELKSIYKQSIDAFYALKNNRYFLAMGDRGIVKVYDMRMAFDNAISFQDINTNGSSIIAMNENDGVIITIKENEGMKLWKFEGDTMFTDDEVTQVLAKIGEGNFVKERVKINKRKFLLGTNDTKIIEQYSNKTIRTTQSKVIKTEQSHRNTDREEEEEKLANDLGGMIASEENPNREMIKIKHDKMIISEENEMREMVIHKAEMHKDELIITEYKSKEIQNDNSDSNTEGKELTEEENIKLQKKFYFSINHLPDRGDYYQNIK